MCVTEIFPSVHRIESSVKLTLDQCAILTPSPEGWSHRPQTTTQEGDHMAVVMRPEACRERGLLSLLLAKMLKHICAQFNIALYI